MCADEARYFPMFRTRSGTKRVYIVRHGESAYNEAVARGASWADPLIFDARLTEKGRQQVGNLLGEVAGCLAGCGVLWQAAGRGGCRFVAAVGHRSTSRQSVHVCHSSLDK